MGHATEYIDRYGGLGKMLEWLLRGEESGEEEEQEQWNIFSVVDGDFSFEDYQLIESYEGFVITASSADAHADHLCWIDHLCRTLQHLHIHNKKLLGICFGHQILARALGGKTRRAPVGWELGVKHVHLNTDMISKLYGLNLISPLKVIETHRNQAEVASDAIQNFEGSEPDQEVLNTLCKRFLKGNRKVIPEIHG